jgi:hypothetical protein
MTEKKGRPEVIDVKAVLAGDDTFIRTVVLPTRVISVRP